MVDVVHGGHDGAVLEREVVVDELANIVGDLPGAFCLDPALLCGDDLHSGEVCCEGICDLLD